MASMSRMATAWATAALRRRATDARRGRGSSTRAAAVPFCCCCWASYSGPAARQRPHPHQSALAQRHQQRPMPTTTHRAFWTTPPTTPAAFSSATSVRLFATTGTGTRSMSSSSENENQQQQQESKSVLQFHDTPLGRNGTHLLDGLDHYVVPSLDDGHPLSVYGIHSTRPIQHQYNNNDYNSNSNSVLKPILLLHGRTWSSVPVFHLLGGPQNKKLLQQQQQHNNNSKLNPTQQSTGGENSHHEEKGVPVVHHESRSLMEALLHKGLQPYCMDFRGFGGTHPDETGCVEPTRCVSDAESVLQWISARHGIDMHNTTTNPKALPALLGWSQGALIAQLAAQKHTPALSKVILYGSIYDPLVRYAREPLYLSNPKNHTSQPHHLNHYDAAIEDFTVEGTIPPEPAKLFAQAALLSDPVKAVWKNVYQFNNCDPARVHVPCLVVAGDQDPYAPLHVQQELFCNLGRASDRTWSIVSGSDHACHLLDGRFRLINTVVAFVMNGDEPQ